MRRQSRNDSGSTNISKPAMLSYSVTASKQTQLCVTKDRTYSISTRNNQETQVNNHEMGAFQLSGDVSLVLDFHKTLRTSSCCREDLSQQSSMGHISKSGCCFVIRHKLLQLTHLWGKFWHFLRSCMKMVSVIVQSIRPNHYISSLIEIIHKRDIGKEVLIRRFMKGIFHLWPVLPNTIFTWDVVVVLLFNIHGQQLRSCWDGQLT